MKNALKTAKIASNAIKEVLKSKREITKGCYQKCKDNKDAEYMAYYRGQIDLLNELIGDGEGNVNYI